MVTSLLVNMKSQSSGLLASITAVTTLWSASAGISAIQKGLKKITVNPARKGSKLIALLYTFLFIIMIPAMLLFQMPALVRYAIAVCLVPIGVKYLLPISAYSIMASAIWAVSCS